jgi:hypothetical protein
MPRRRPIAFLAQPIWSGGCCASLHTHAPPAPPWVPVVPPAAHDFHSVAPWQVAARRLLPRPVPALARAWPRVPSVSQAPNHTPNLPPLFLDPPPPPPPSRSTQRHTIPFQRDPLLASRQHFRVDRIPRRPVPRFTFFQPAVQQPTAPRQRLASQSKPNPTRPNHPLRSPPRRPTLAFPCFPLPRQPLLPTFYASPTQTTLFRFTFFAPYDPFRWLLQSLESNLNARRLLSPNLACPDPITTAKLPFDHALAARNPPTPASTPSTSPR